MVITTSSFLLKPGSTWIPLKKYKNFRNNFHKRYIESGDAADFGRYKQHSLSSLINSYTSNILLIYTVN